MSQNDLADDLYWSPGTRSVCGGMSAQIMWPQVDPYQFPCLFHNQSCSSIGYGEDSLPSFYSFLTNVVPESDRKLWRNEHDLFSPSAFGIPDNQSPAINIIGSEVEDFTDSHTASSHEFQKQPITCFCGSKDNFINGLFFDDIPVHCPGWPEKFLQHRCIAGILKIRIEGFAHEVEEGSKM